ncbi:NAD(P)-binding Rossmann-fold superfamily protein [Klebsormidium nitens]|uniref:NAD(P)-binding Rossmann-fold superfamily protein n=1 Tax=Klebsormidium nitens TaxID=105231 RepID=A0A1Y1I9K0_KLENI|nr:NAD(P)-binding Rossmann-fold superfamily protein [Klebsormidium nitens]|eukprot:GAQ87233.1 NAD(P)-binding Rossmann-fold superfamily protein [Klebsormidium nitens]
MDGPKVALVTGCSEGGIGAALCEALLKRGCRVFATARRLESMTKLEALGCCVVQLDVCEEASIRDCVETVVAKAGRVDILVNNAGVGAVGPLMDLPMEAMRQLFETNVYGTVAVSQAVFPIMAKQGGGTIANIGSIVGWMATPWTAAYCASKAAIQSLSDSMRLEMKPFGVDVVLINPGVVETNLGQNNASRQHLNRNGHFAPFEEAIRTKAVFAHKRGATPANVFAEKAAATLLKPKPPRHWFFGQHSLTLFIVSHVLPLLCRDWILARQFGLNVRITGSQAPTYWKGNRPNSGDESMGRLTPAGSSF